MPCFINGQPMSSTITVNPPEHVRMTDVAEGSAAETISIETEATHELQMEQLTMHFSAIPTTAGTIVLTKKGVNGPDWNTELRVIDPVAEAVTDIVCVIPFTFYPGDTVSLAYANPDDLNVTAEILLVRVD